jgi:peptidoglycan/LPS O-acetylase OafA/YrhL
MRPSSGPRLVGIEGLRAIAAFSILVYHAWLYSAPDGRRVNVWLLWRFLPDLSFGVVLFFTLSGFLLYRPFAAAILRERPGPSIKAYLRNRALRILPAYLVILVFVSVLFRAALMRSEGSLLPGPMHDPTLLTRNALFVENYAPSTLGTGIGPAWSLVVEVVFYLSLPFLALFAAVLARRAATRSRRRLAALAPAAAMLVVGLVGKGAAAYLVPPAWPYAGWNADWHSVLERSFLCHADLFAFGMALAVIRVESEDGLLRLPRGWRVAAIVGALSAYLVTAKMTFLDEQLSYSPYNTLMALAFSLVLALVVLPAREARRPRRIVKILESRPFVGAGLVSYSVFLWHEPLVRWMRMHGLTLGGPGGFFANVVTLAALTGFLSLLTYRFVELPALRRKRRTQTEAVHRGAVVVPGA